jgi:hypothetical protein
MCTRVMDKPWTMSVRMALSTAMATFVAVTASPGYVVVGEAQGQDQAQTYQAPRLPGTDRPDLSGIWQAFVTANWDLEPHGADAGPFPRLLGVWGAQPPGEGVVVGKEIPYLPEALARRDENRRTRLTVDTNNVNTVGDPEAKCYMPGVPRATYMPFPFQIIQSTEKIVIAYQFSSANRTIPLTRPTEAPVDSWMGWSNGHWDGDTLVVDVSGFHDLSWFDRAGNYHSEALRVVERYTPVSPYHLMYEATIEDPNVFSRPWTIRLPLYRRIEANARLLEFKCVDLAEEYVYGSLVETSNSQGGGR